MSDNNVVQMAEHVGFHSAEPERGLSWSFQLFIEICCIHIDDLHIWPSIKWEAQTSALCFYFWHRAMIINFWKSMEDRLEREGV